MDDDYGDAGYGDDEFGDVDAEVDAEDGEVCPSRHCCTPALTMLPLAAQAQPCPFGSYKTFCIIIIHHM